MPWLEAGTESRRIAAGTRLPRAGGSFFSAFAGGNGESYGLWLSSPNANFIAFWAVSGHNGHGRCAYAPRVGVASQRAR